jgi:ATP-binding cassette subfamily F protein uup
MALITLKDVSWGLGGENLIDNASVQIEKGERVCLLGRNGAGKSTLLRIIDGTMSQDNGQIWRQQGMTVATLEQEVPRQTGGTVFDVVARGLGDMGQALGKYQRLGRNAEAGSSPERLEQRDNLRNHLDMNDGWTRLQQIDAVLTRAGLDPRIDFDTLSAGMKRRALFCRAAVGKPDLFLLDEPTNHLDVDTIVWMEDYILRHMQTVLFVSHDRAFAARIANRIMELDRGRLVSYACDFATYLKRKEADALSEMNRDRQFDKKLSQEEAWIRQGIKARRTRNEGRVRALKKMRDAYRARRGHVGNVSMQAQDAERTGKLVIQAKGIDYAYKGTPYIRDFSMEIMRGEKIGLIGPNGTGKTTLLKILTGEIPPDNGSVRHGTRLQVAYFDQLRSRLWEDKSVIENIGEGNDFIVFNGHKRHVISYLKDFLFLPERCHTPVHILSGGEKNRLMLAKLFAKPSNVLVMDEPTNDLDAETLELLEELLLEFPGTLLLVSHDRTFLNNVVTGTLAFEGNGTVRAYPGGYDDWLNQRPQPTPSVQRAAKSPKALENGRKPAKPRKLGYMEQRELDALPRKIDQLENEQRAIFAAMSDPDFYKNNKADITAMQSRLQEVEALIASAYEKWEALESLQSQ